MYQVRKSPKKSLRAPCSTYAPTAHSHTAQQRSSTSVRQGRLGSKMVGEEGREQQSSKANEQGDTENEGLLGSHQNRARCVVRSAGFVFRPNSPRTCSLEVPYMITMLLLQSNSRAGYPDVCRLSSSRYELPVSQCCTCFCCCMPLHFLSTAAQC